MGPRRREAMRPEVPEEYSAYITAVGQPGGAEKYYCAKCELTFTTPLQAMLAHGAKHEANEH